MLESLNKESLVFLGINKYYVEPKKTRGPRNKIPAKELAKLIHPYLLAGESYSSIAKRFEVSDLRIHAIARQYYPEIVEERSAVTKERKDKEDILVEKAWRKYGKLNIALKALEMPYQKGYRIAMRIVRKYKTSIEELNKEFTNGKTD